MTKGAFLGPSDGTKAWPAGLERHPLALRRQSPHPMLAGVGCCDPNGLDRMFAGRLVLRELKAWRREGLSRRQRSIVEELEPLTPGASVLDIGCGIGAVGTTLLAKGAGKGTSVDVSAAYLGAAREVAAQTGVADSSSSPRP